MQLTSEETAYLAGLFDGEGSFGIRRPSRLYNGRGVRYAGEAFISMGNTNIKLISYVQEKLGGRVYRCRPANKTCKEFWTWNAKGSEIIDICRLLLPFAVGRKKQISLLLKFRKLVEGKDRQSRSLTIRERKARNRIRRAIARLNQKGGNKIHRRFHYKR